MKQELIQDLVNVLKSGKEFINEQAPDVIQQLYLAAKIEDTACLLIGAAFLIASIWLYTKGFRANKKDRYDGDGYMIIAAGVGLIAFIMVAVSSVSLAQLKYTPKAVLLQMLLNTKSK